MAEPVISFLLEKLSSLLVQEINLLRGLDDDIQGIIDELKSIQALLKDADTRAAAEEEGEGDEGVREWVKQLTQEAYRIEDVIDEYMVHLAHPPDRCRGLIGCLQKIAHFINKLKARHDIATKIQKTKSSLQDIKQRSKEYQFLPTEQASRRVSRYPRPHDPRVASLYIEEDEVVGIESNRELLIDGLVKGELNRTVISLVGMGGLGKTTLAKKVYDDQTVVRHFDCHAWITVRKEYTQEDVLRMLINEFYRSTEETAPADMDRMRSESLIQELKKFLENRRYIVVFDGVRKEDFWRDVEHALCDNKMGSRVMITTQNREIATFCRSSSIVNLYEIKPLPKEKALELFCKKAFFNSGGRCPTKLEKLSDEIVERCQGLPLGIATIGSLLATKPKLEYEWKRIYDSLGSSSGPHVKSFIRVVSESYHDLPYHLKSCLLYFGLFPKSYSVSCIRLIRLWVAEGLVERKIGLTPEQVAAEYLIELIHRSLVQVSEASLHGEVKRCRVHDMMHDIILMKTKEMNFSGVWEEEGLGFGEKTRRISIQKVAAKVQEGTFDSMTRSILFFKVDELPNSALSSIIRCFKLVKVLDFQEAPLHNLPEEVGNLLHLRYLSVRATKVQALPKSIGKLRYLETLDLKRSLVSELPIEICNLKNLRHLPAGQPEKASSSVTDRSGVKIPEGIGSLQNLQKLSSVDADQDDKLIQELGKLRNIRKLGITRLTKKNGKVLCTCIERMKFLESLEIRTVNKEEALDLQTVYSPPRFLQRLYLHGHSKNLPSWIAKLQDLNKVRLYYSQLPDDPFYVLQDLPNLSDLDLYEAYDGEQMQAREGSFQKLKFLRIASLKKLKSVNIKEGAFPNLEDLRIVYCVQMDKAPSGIQNLRNLKRFVFHSSKKPTYYYRTKGLAEN